MRRSLTGRFSRLRPVDGADTLARLVPRFGRYNVDDLRPADFVEWRSEVARWILNGMPSASEARGRQARAALAGDG
jgi:hypothetical protein